MIPSIVVGLLMGLFIILLGLIELTRVKRKVFSIESTEWINVNLKNRLVDSYKFTEIASYLMMIFGVIVISIFFILDDNPILSTNDIVASLLGLLYCSVSSPFIILEINLIQRDRLKSKNSKSIFQLAIFRLIFIVDLMAIGILGGLLCSVLV